MKEHAVDLYISQHEWDTLPEEQKQQIVAAIAENKKSSTFPKRKKAVMKDSFYVRYGKRMLDIGISGTVLVLTCPVNLALMIATYFDVGKPLIFKQERIGRNRKSFYLCKFRNMTNETNENGVLLPPDQRVTKWGKFVRRTSLDELLNLWCIFKGDMSVIGPRPLPKKYEKRFSDYHQQRHMVRPGLECPFHDPKLASKGWEGRFDNDIWYVEHVSFGTDVMMFGLLVKKVFSRSERNASADGKTGEFIGYNPDGTIMHESEIPHVYLDRLKKATEEASCAH